MLQLDDESKIVKKLLVIKNVFGYLLGWMARKFAAKNIFL